MIRSAILFLLVFSLLTVSCGLFGSSDSGPPDSVEGTWEGDLEITASVDTADDFEGWIGSQTVTVTRTYKLVIADDEGNLSAEIDLEDNGRIITDESGIDGVNDTTSINGEYSGTATGTYGKPNMVLEVENLDDVSPGFGNEWNFELTGGQEAQGDVGIEIPFRSLSSIPPAPSTYWRFALDEKNEDITLTLNRQ